MQFTPAQIARLEQLFESVRNETYPETPSLEHTDITAQMLPRMWAICALPPGSRILDVGCGQGVALHHFLEKGMNVTGITLNRKDVEICRSKGYPVLEMDQSFLDFPDREFDLIWCRHCIEHSVMPYFTLQEFFRVIKPGGWLYVEVPAPDTSCQHQTNQNHYAVMGKTMWAALMRHAGFELREQLDIKFRVPAGPDEYWAFVLRRP